ncbi:MAG TPA: uroporphyrinogen-III C-methyltransferase, partial [Acidobacteriota bacterium]|nr:uroporphyrinogen-III C-methyltransferase [Acidobacteriota bacterium]
IDQARQGKRVVRLKGGDPFVFGRGGEEALALTTAGIPFEIVPGISSALAAPAYAGIPLTHRGLSSSFAVVSGARAGDGAMSETLVAETTGADTVVVLMGMAQLRSIVAEFIAAGRPATTPVAVIRWGTYDGQQKVIGTLETIAETAEQAQMKQPAVIVIGDVVSLHAQLDWFPVKQPAQFAFLAETQGAVSLVSQTENT